MLLSKHSWLPRASPPCSPSRRRHLITAWPGWIWWAEPGIDCQAPIQHKHALNLQQHSHSACGSEPPHSPNSSIKHCPAIHHSLPQHASSYNTSSCGAVQDWMRQDSGLCLAYRGAAGKQHCSKDCRPKPQSHCPCTDTGACKAGAC